MHRHTLTALLLMAPYAAVAAAQDTTKAQNPYQNQSQSKDSSGYQSGYRSGRMNEPQTDEALVMKIHRDNKTEIKVGQLAQQKASSAKAKQFAARVVRDHQAADQKLNAIANQVGIDVTQGAWNDTSAMGQYGRDHDAYGRHQYGDSTQRNDSTYRNQGEMGRRDTTQRSDTAGGYAQGRMHQDTLNGQYGHNQMGQDSTKQDGQREHAQAIEQLNTLTGAEFDRAFANLMVQDHEKAIAMLERAQTHVQNAQLRSFIKSTLPTLRQHLATAKSLGGTSTATATTSSSQ